ncbi:hypothetical protein EST38_g12541 [Candolleomyces aberdarensis]|uniref:Nephrocystin 3-like N-terminal domain-containing protein n=1 Tax=Candolleomyces aberdarensis TaxID=2316362 RepID=A0A4Q2D3A5_9AGAR|nr:hypothetical protein EST38_g12541 [Candolleomyces aberdarensis]
MFLGAHHFNVEGIYIDPSQHIHNGQNKSIDGRNVQCSIKSDVFADPLPIAKGWEILLDKIASNALYDSGARFDPPKCDEDTRVEVIGEIMDWVNDRDAPQRLLCMTGAARSSKSALQQTISERCAGSKILGSTFFFSSQDPTRNDLSRIVPTIAYQLGQHAPTLQDYIRKAIENDRLIFTKTVRTQMDALIVRPFRQFISNSNSDPGNFPQAVLIDGLDECSGEDNQAELLSSIKDSLLNNDLPFRIFIASRPEWTIRSALNPEPQGYLQQSAYHIQLSDKYDATNDIRRYLRRRIQDIGSRSHDPRARSQSWPRMEDVEKLVAAASGQFVYAATVVKYVSERRSSPVDRLQTVVDWTPKPGQLARPFKALDVLYSGILSAAKELYEAVDTNRARDFLLLLRAHHINHDRRVFNVTYEANTFDEFLNLERGAHEVLVSDLHSLLVFDQHPSFTHIFLEMHFYHRSFAEFLDSETRAESFFVAEMQVRTYVLEAIVQGIIRFSLEPNSTISGSTFEKYALKALVMYSNKGKALGGQQLLALAHGDGWRRFDHMVPKTHFHRPVQAYFLEMINVIMRRLKNELNEPELADALKPYSGKWKGLIEPALAERGGALSTFG